MKSVGLCHHCGRPAMMTCPMCGKIICRTCYNPQHGVCQDCGQKKDKGFERRF